LVNDDDNDDNKEEEEEDYYYDLHWPIPEFHEPKILD